MRRPSTDRLNCGRCGNACGDGSSATAARAHSRAATCRPTAAASASTPRGSTGQLRRLRRHLRRAATPARGLLPAAGGHGRRGLRAAERPVCGAVCADIRNDNENCGRCGTRCTADRLCILGACVALRGSARRASGAACIITLGDRANCGRCGNACAATLSCVAGVCSTEPTFRVDGSPTRPWRRCARDRPRHLCRADDRGGIAVSASRVFSTGDTPRCTALSDLGLTAVTGTPAIHDGCCSATSRPTRGVRAQRRWRRAHGHLPLDALHRDAARVINGTTGALTATRIPLLHRHLVQNAGIFSAATARTSTRARSRRRRPARL